MKLMDMKIIGIIEGSSCIKMNVELLDCTLRDGGYVNNWDFSNNQVKFIIKHLVESGVRVIEIGILGKYTNAKGTKFSCFDEIKRLDLESYPDVKYALMINYADSAEVEIPNSKDSNIEIIRIAFFKNEYLNAINYARSLKDKGYDIFMQPMATTMYDAKELKRLIDAINELQPYAFYMVDSFGTMFTDDVKEMAQSINDNLEENIKFGFHAHNNMQMAVSNVVCLKNLMTNRPLYIDCTVFGMGRGAGNVPTEIIQFYLNKENKIYDIDKVIEIYETFLNSIFNNLPWGYSMQYFISAMFNTNSAYAWYINKKGINSFKEQMNIFKLIPDIKRYTLMKDTINSILEYFQEGNSENDRKC